MAAKGKQTKTDTRTPRAIQDRAPNQRTNNNQQQPKGKQVRDLEQLIERVQEIRNRLRHLADSLPTAKGDPEAIERIETERAQLNAELLAIGAEGMAQIDDPIVRSAVGRVIASMRDEINPDTPAPTDEPTPDPLEQARAIIDGHASEIGRTTGQMFREILPMLERSLHNASNGRNDTDENEHAGLRIYALTVEMSHTDPTEQTGMVGIQVSHLANFGGPDELYDLVQEDEAIKELAKVLDYKLHALALVAYGKGEYRPIEGDDEPRPIECKVTTIIHPRGMVSYLRERIGNTYGEPDEPMVIVDDSSSDEQIQQILERHGRVPYTLAYLYSETLREIVQHHNN